MPAMLHSPSLHAITAIVGSKAKALVVISTVATPFYSRLTCIIVSDVRFTSRTEYPTRRLLWTAGASAQHRVCTTGCTRWDASRTLTSNVRRMEQAFTDER